MARRYTIDDWQQKLDNLNQSVLVESKRVEDKKEIFTIRCLNCNNTFEVKRKALSTACLLRESGKCKTKWCPVCNKKRSVEGLNDIATVRKDLVKYFVNSDDAKKCSMGSHKKVRLICPECNNEKIIDVSALCTHGFHCDYCSDGLSLGNKIIRNLCLQLPLTEYAFEFSSEWSQNKRYDCYFSYKSRRYLIEVDGRQHIEDTTWATKKQQVENDNLKTDLAIKNGFGIIRIKAYKTDFDYIKEDILKSKLSEIFDLSNIDWDVLYKQTITSLNVQIANYYTEHQDLTLNDIAEHFNLSEPTVRKALRILAKVGLCDYSKEKVFRNAMRINMERKRGKINK